MTLTWKSILLGAFLVLALGACRVKADVPTLPSAELRVRSAEFKTRAAATFSGVKMALVVQSVPNLYDLVIVRWLHDSTFGRHPQCGLVFRTNVVAAKVLTRERLSDPWGWTFAYNTGVGRTNLVGKVCRPNPQSGFFDVEVIE